MIVGLQTRGEVLRGAVLQIEHAAIGEFAETSGAGDRSLVILAVLERSHIVGLLAKPSVVGGGSALIGSRGVDIEQIAAMPHEVESGYERVGVIGLRGVLHLVEDIVVIFIIGVCLLAEIVGVLLVIIKRTVGIIAWQGARGVVGIVERRYLRRQIVFLLHTAVEAHVGLKVLGEVHLHTHRRRVALAVLSLHHGILVGIAERGIVAIVVAAARHTQGVSLREGITAEDLKPVGVDTLILAHLLLKLIIVGVAVDVVVICSLVSHHRHV